MAITAVTLAPMAGAVSSVGPGVGGPHGHIGATVEPGIGNVYCIDSSLDISFGRGIVSDTIVSSVPARAGVVGAIDAGPDAVRGMNFIASTWGGTSDDVTAAAVGIATMAFVKAGGFATAASYTTRSDVIERARSMYDQAQGIIDAGDGESASGEVTLTIDPSDDYRGRLRVAATVPATGTLTLTNGIFAENNSDTLTGVRTDVDYPIIGVPPTADGAPYRIGAASAGDFSGGQTWPDRVRVLDYGSSYQRVITGIGPVALRFPVHGEDQRDRSTTFHPVLTSRTAPVSPNGQLSDTLTFTTAPDENGVNNGWPRDLDGAHRLVSFTVTAYATGSSAPAESPDVPQDAVAVGAATVRATGPGTTQTVTIPGTHPQGRYTFVASYDEAGTPPETRPYLPADYAWSHAFGMESETTTVPMKIMLSSKILSDAVGPAGRGDDAVTLSTAGPWLADAAGRPIEVVALGHYVHLPAGTTGAADELPEGAEVRGTVRAVFTASGTQETMTLEVLSGEIAAPETVEGTMSWQWSIPRDAQTWPDLVIPSQEKVGLPEQTQLIRLPLVTTRAQSDVDWGGTATDTAIVTGPLPGTGAVTVRWEAFRGPDGASDLTSVCTPENRLPLDGTPVAVTTTPGEYQSPAVQDVRFPVVWQEIATWIPSSGAPVDYHRGECGVPHEISTPAPPEASAPASRLAATGGGAATSALWLAGGLGAGGLAALLLAMRLRRARRSSLAR
ncbi:hypothetical protein [Microbacterium sp. NPDC056052]|uniref:hypothetical protein n=1 Tax=Microbacterium sp. NPDC056052 TaxID=3345695 RepID=UPI0035E0E3B4